MPGPIFTIGCSGTGFGPKSSEIIYEFMQGIIGIAYTNATQQNWTKLHLNGAGSTQQFLPEQTALSKPTTANNTIPKPRTLGFLNNFPRVADYATGNSMYANIQKAIDAFKNRPDINADTEFTVNLFGWSRGGATIVAIANELAKNYPRATINLFMLDPLTGPGHNKEELAIIPAAVQQATVVYAQGEAKFNVLRLPLANPTNLTVADTSKTNVTIIRTPGMHNSFIKHGWSSNDQIEPIAIWDQLYTFLTEHGTVIDPTKMQQNYIEGEYVSAGLYQQPDDYQRLEVWSQLSCDVAGSQRGKIYDAKRQEIPDNASNCLLNNPEFEKLLKDACPELTNALKQHHYDIEAPAITEELAKLANHRCQQALQQLQTTVTDKQSWLATQINKALEILKSLPALVKNSVNKNKYSTNFTSRLNLLWSRPMDLSYSCEPWRNGVLSLCHDYLSNRLTRHHTELFELLAKICLNGNPISSVELSMQDYLQRYGQQMNKDGLGYNACTYIQNQIDIEKERIAKPNPAPVFSL
jgi:hypothetical protein